MAATISLPEAAAERNSGRTDLLAAVAAALVMLGIHAAQGFPTLETFGGDNDSLMRLVQVRDLIAGQGWFDLTQYRMGPEGGFVMHWSRLVDAPIAALILAGAAVTGSQTTGETFALLAWPALLFVAALWLTLRMARRLGGEAAMLPALVVGGAALYFLAIFAPGAIDHHNVQLVLALAAVTGLLAGGFAPGLVAGAASALMLAVGMEAAPYVAVGGAVAAGSFLWGGAAGTRAAAGFGSAFALTAGIALVPAAPPGAWTTTACDAFSGAHAALAAVAGAGLGVLASTLGRARFTARLAAAAGLGALLAGLVLMLAPECLSDPYAGLDPRLKSYWLEQVTEAQSLLDILKGAPLMAAGYYATPLVALFVLALRGSREGLRRDTLVAGVFLVAAITVSAWQVRGAMFSIPLAVAPLSAWIGTWRERAAANPGRGSIAMAAAWLVSVNAVWSGAADALSAAPVPEAGAALSTDPCQSASDYAALAAQPAGVVMTISNLGAPILRFTHHRVLAGPYHRNVAGNLAALDALMSEPKAAYEALRRSGATLLAICPGNDETAAIVEWAPDGLLARVTRGDTPAWLSPAGIQNGPILILTVH